MRKPSEILSQISSLLAELGQYLDANQNQETKPAAKLVDSNLEKLKLLVKSNEWPVAVSPESLVQTEEDKEQRAIDIVESYVEVNSGDRFLDFGCGEGHVAKAAVTRAQFSAGYDPAFGETQKTDNLLLTNDFAEIVSYGPYDTILLYDVLDHCEFPEEALKQVKSVCHPETKIIVCCHPWCGRHGGHLYRTVNKAFVHLLPQEILDELMGGEKQMYCQKIMYPVQTYGNWFRNVGFSETYSFVERGEIESFFASNQHVKKYILGLFNQNNNFPQKQMDQLFVKYQLKIK